MMKLRAPIFLFILIASFKISNAQIHVGVKAGVNFSNITTKDQDGNKGDTQSMPGIQVGLTVDLPLIDDLYLQPAIQYSGKGFKQTDNGFSGKGNTIKVNVTYFELPVNLLYKPKLGPGKLLIGAGGYMGYGTGGTWESNTTVLIGDIMIDNKGDAIFKNNAMDGEFGNYNYGRPLDYGASFLAGYEILNKYSIQFNGQIGLANLEPKYDGMRKAEIKNKAYSITLGYKF